MKFNFEGLEVYQDGIGFANKVYSITNSFLSNKRVEF